MTEAEMLRRMSRHSFLRVVSAVWTPTGGQATGISGYFKDESATEHFVEDASPTLEVAASTVPGVVHGDAVSFVHPETRLSTDYTVAGVTQDGKGFKHLALQKVD
jgi:hypothetical protein